MSRSAILAVALAAAAIPAALGAGARTWKETPLSLRRGAADGVAISASGALFMAPRIERLGSEATPGRPDQVWAVAADRRGNLYMGTGPDGRILRVSSGGTRSEFFTVDEPLVTALAFTPTGDLLAGSAPGGKIYRIDASGNGTVWCETGERYVWALAATAGGEIFAATGERGGVLRIADSGDAEPFFDSDEPHLVSLIPLPGGGLLAGGAGRGLIYEIDPEGHGIVRHDGDLPEVAALAVEPDGSILAALVAPPIRKERRPALKLRLPDGTRVGATNENVGALEERRGPVLRGTIEGLPEPAAAAPPLRGLLIRVGPEGETAELWRSSTEAPLSLLGGAGAETWFGTGEPARLYRIDGGDDVSLLGTLNEAQITALARVGRSVVLSTSNPADAYRILERDSDTAVFTSAPVDTGAPSRWGSLRWSVEGESGRVELYTRTGNSRIPDGTWSAWSPVLTDPTGSRIANPEGRFLQWRVRFVGGRGSAERLSDLRLSYEPFNRPPGVGDFRLDNSDAAVSGDAVFAWSASDPDGDAVEVRLEYRATPSTEWAPLAGEPAAGEPGDGAAEGKDSGSPRGRLVWNTRERAEGTYEIRAVASDRAANGPDEGRETVAEPSLRVIVDRSPPELIVRPQAPGNYQVTLIDALSAVGRLELYAGETRVHSLRCDDGVCDSAEESFRVVTGEGGSDWRVRGVDAAGNTVESALNAP